ncbi:MAG: hypothetical protein ACE5KZ_00310 [Candidatus Scalinduaceae bacterium]
MKKNYEGYWFRSHQDSVSMWHSGLYEEDKYYSHDDYDENEPDSPTDDLTAVKENKKILSENEITKGILDFLEVGMKYKINVEVKENKYCLEIEAI